MKTLKYAFSIQVIFMLITLVRPADACEVTFRPARLSGKLGQTVQVTAVVWWEHRRCILGKDEVDIEVDGGKLITQGGWIKVGRGVYENVLKIKLERKGTVLLDVHRRCRKKGLSKGVLKISVK